MNKKNELRPMINREESDQDGPMVRVISVQRGALLVSDGSREWLCTPSGKLRHENNGVYPVTGDWVLTRESVVTKVLPRTNMLARGAAGTHDATTGAARRGQAIGANIDTVFIVCGLDRDYNLRRVERYLTLVYNCGLSPVVVLTKADLHEAPEGCAAEVESVAFGVSVVLASNLDGRGLGELETYLGPGRTVVMIGSSGAGKSTLANSLYGSDIQATGAVSASIGKGRHHTTTRELIAMPQGGMLMDNPGIREVALFLDGNRDTDGMDTAFPDILELARGCRFADCTHSGEPGCAVTAAVEEETLSPGRLESFRKMRREMDYLAQRSAKSADRVEKERWKGVAMQIRDVKKRKKHRS